MRAIPPPRCTRSLLPLSTARGQSLRLCSSGVRHSLRPCRHAHSLFPLPAEPGHRAEDQSAGRQEGLPARAAGAGMGARKGRGRLPHPRCLNLNPNSNPNVNLNPGPGPGPESNLNLIQGRLPHPRCGPALAKTQCWRGAPRAQARVRGDYAPAARATLVNCTMHSPPARPGCVGMQQLESGYAQTPETIEMRAPWLGVQITGCLPDNAVRGLCDAECASPRTREAVACTIVSKVFES